MKMTKKIMSLAIVFAMVMAMSVTAFAQTVPENAVQEAGKGSITITNASKGETYAIYKLFDATVTGTKGGSIAYTGTIPESLKDYFTADTAGNISLDYAEGKTEDDLFAALKTWAADATATAETVSDGSELTFANLAYGYYVVTTTQGNTAITVTSTNPTAEIVDKNSTVAGVGLTKKVNGLDEDDVQIGDTVTYTVTFPTANYQGAGEEATQITKYTIVDTLPNFLENVQVTSIIVDEDANIQTTEDQKNLTANGANFGTTKTIDLVWAENNVNLYKNGALVVITYTADVTKNAGATNTNEVTLTWTDCPKAETADAVIKTYFFDLVKTDVDNNVIEDAHFELYRGTTKLSFVKEGNVYRVADKTETADKTTTIIAGNVEIKGLDKETYTLKEIKAPDGYNMLTTDISVELDKDGFVADATVNNNVYATGGVEVENKTGTELPSTGGIGTTIFYALGGLMAVGAGVLLVAKKRMEA